MEDDHVSRSWYEDEDELTGTAQANDPVLQVCFCVSVLAVKSWELLRLIP